ncbi:hypothetical protein [Halothermothrix orenii]|uniref:Uncharacterized protein n=1 Tax=Halothermothrix orenii (strain H 168 / OCM 544 / DSM 9562) TaxID=373903 RepID=B8CZJ2_HALOH|nr:hypothetical protein [Halothermothrix orenii]ACL70711.1 hypothetical protein Hore_19640 [Halothermothrix orenii H 168]
MKKTTEGIKGLVKKVLPVIGTLFILAGILNGSPVTGKVKAYHFNMDLVNEYSFRHVTPPGPVARKDTITEAATEIQLDFSGLVGNYQYSLGVKGDWQKFRADFEEITISGFAGPGVFEAGKRDWRWGEGFSYSPTYPLKADRNYWGGEFNLPGLRYNLSFGSAVVDGNEIANGKDINTGSWIRVGSLMNQSDYKVVMSYLKKDNETREGSNGQVDNINLGGSYSRDFLNGFALQVGANLSCYPGDTVSYQYLVGGKYTLPSGHILVGEVYRDRSGHDQILINFINGDLMSDWQWQIRDVVNWSDYGEIRTLSLDYIGDDNITPGLEINNYQGSYGVYHDWKLTFRVKISI